MFAPTTIRVCHIWAAVAVLLSMTFLYGPWGLVMKEDCQDWQYYKDDACYNCHINCEALHRKTVYVCEYDDRLYEAQCGDCLPGYDWIDNGMSPEFQLREPCFPCDDEHYTAITTVVTTVDPTPTTISTTTASSPTTKPTEHTENQNSEVTSILWSMGGSVGAVIFFIVIAVVAMKYLPRHNTPDTSSNREGETHEMNPLNQQQQPKPDEEEF